MEIRLAQGPVGGGIYNPFLALTLLKQSLTIPKSSPEIDRIDHQFNMGRCIIVLPTLQHYQ